MTTLFKTLAFATFAALFIQAAPLKNETLNEGITFYEGSWQEALATAKAENKLIFLDAYASWCGPCKMLKRNVFTNPDVAAFYNENFVNVAIDMEKGVGPKLAQQYRVTAYPTLFFIDGDGNVVRKAVGYHNPNQLLALGQSMIAP
jgi:thioredoxin 1